MAKYQPKTGIFGKRQGADNFAIMGAGGGGGRIGGSGGVSKPKGGTGMIGRTTQKEARRRQSGSALATNYRRAQKFGGGR